MNTLNNFEKSNEYLNYTNEKIKTKLDILENTLTDYNEKSDKYKELSAKINEYKCILEYFQNE